MDELKPCPFCGGKAYLDLYILPKYEYVIRCNVCSLEFGLYLGRNKEEAIEAWNRRADNGREAAD